MDNRLQRHHYKTLHFEHEWHSKATRKKIIDVLYEMQEKSTYIHLGHTGYGDIMRCVHKQNRPNL